MYSVWQRLGTLTSFFSTCLFTVLPLIAVLNFLMRVPEPPVSLQVDTVSNKLGVEDYFMNRKVMLTDLSLNLDAGTTLGTAQSPHSLSGRFCGPVPLEHEAALPLRDPRV